MIDNLSGLLQAIQENGENYNPTSGQLDEISHLHFKQFNGDYFCPKCGDIRKAAVSRITSDDSFRASFKKQIVFDDLPWLLKVKCLQCESEALLLIYNGINDYELACLHNTYGGCFTPHTPDSVKYYIDQAFRARSVGAVSASMSMYRSALECVLYDQDYTSGMLDSKIKQLEKDITGGTAPKWAIDIDTAFLKEIKELGNGSIHPNGGDILKQNEIDKELLELVDIIFSELLDKIYEQPVRSQENLRKLQLKSELFKNK